MSISSAVKDEQLLQFVGVPLMVGLFDGDREIDDVERQPVEFSAPMAEDGSDVRFVENVSEVRFQDIGQGHHYTAFGLFDTSGELRATFPLLEPRDMPADDDAKFKAGKLRIGMP